LADTWLPHAATVDVNTDDERPAPDLVAAKALIVTA
jgi:hypothetical protein